MVNWGLLEFDQYTSITALTPLTLLSSYQHPSGIRSTPNEISSKASAFLFEFPFPPYRSGSLKFQEECTLRVHVPFNRQMSPELVLKSRATGLTAGTAVRLGRERINRRLGASGVPEWYD